MHGSGTSLTANYLHYCGVSMVGMETIDSLGEYRSFRNISHKILRDSRIHRYGLKFKKENLSPSLPTITKMKEKIKETIHSENGNWGWKAPINSLTIWEWLPLLSVYTSEITVIHVFREPWETTRSFYRRKSSKDIIFVGRKGHPYKNLERIWCNYNRSVLEFEKENANKYKFVYASVRKIVEDPESFLRLLGIKYKPIEEVFRQGRLKKASKSVFYTDEAQEIWTALEEKQCI